MQPKGGVGAVGGQQRSTPTYRRMATPTHVAAARQADVRDETAARLRALLASIKHLPPESVDVGNDDDFLHLLGMDSIDAVELTVQLDLVFDLGFGTDPDDLDRLADFGSLVDLVATRGRLEASSDGRIDERG
jgi:acyl carrier protein